MNDLCIDTVTREWSTDFRLRAHRERIPISGVLELTSRCNSRCQHCYLGDQEAQHAQRKLECSTEAIKASLKEWADAGCLYLLITGGDPMLRSDFPEVYRAAYELGLLITVFCNGTLVDDAIVELFQELPPRKVEVSIYGATARTHELVTQVPRSHEEAWVGIRKLLDGGVRFGLKTVLLTLNQHEIEAMEEQANELGVPFRRDADLIPCVIDAGHAPLDLRISPEEAIAYEMKSPEVRDRWKKQIEKISSFPQSETLYGCGAGATSFHADPFGDLSPCLVAAQYKVPMNERSFKDVWDNELGLIQAKRKKPGHSRLSGVHSGACASCPAANYLETGNENVQSDYVVQTTQLRYRAVMKSETEDEL